MEARAELHDRLRKRYLERLAHRLKRMRRLLLERDWEELRWECRQLRGGGGGEFGFHRLAELAAAAEGAIPERAVLKAEALPEARARVEELATAIDQLLAAHDTVRSLG